MKRTILTLVTAVALMATTMASAENITVGQAKDAAAYYLQHYSNLTRLSANQLTLVRQWNNPDLGVPSMYLLAAPEQGWIIMTATTVMNPVVAFADDAAIDPDDMAPQFEALLADYNVLVCDNQNADAEKALGENPKWTVLLNHGLKSGETKSGTFLLTTSWHQGSDDGSDYNMYSPVVNGITCPTGCVATALAQICKYYSYPKKPVGTKTYTWYKYYSGLSSDKILTARFADSAALDYTLMPNKVSQGTNLNRRREVSRLAYYVGLAVEMQFGVDGSSSTDQAAFTNMPRHFKFTSGTMVDRRSTNDTAFLNSVRRELERNRPMYMSGASSTGSDVHAAGHAWVCDGWNSDNGLYHMNWGWGQYGGNGWFDLAANDMTNGSHNFNLQHTVIIGMIPPADSTDRDVYVGIPVTAESDVVFGAAYPNPASHSITLPYNCLVDTEMQVYSVNGRLVESLRLTAGDGEVTLSVEGLPAGIYIYRVGTTHGKFIVR